MPQRLMSSLGQGLGGDASQQGTTIDQDLTTEDPSPKSDARKGDRAEMSERQLRSKMLRDILKERIMCIDGAM